MLSDDKPQMPDPRFSLHELHQPGDNPKWFLILDLKESVFNDFNLGEKEADFLYLFPSSRSVISFAFAGLMSGGWTICEPACYTSHASLAFKSRSTHFK